MQRQSSFRYSYKHIFRPKTRIDKLADYWFSLLYFYHSTQGEQVRKYFLILMSMLAISFSASADNTMKTQTSKHGFNDTQTKLDAVLKEKGLTVFAKIDHADGAQKAD